MSIINERQKELLKQKDTPLWGGYVNMLKELASIFLSNKHWILEFIQNAEDASKDIKKGKLLIEIDNDYLRIFNNGKEFDTSDFLAITDVKSAKLPYLGFRGYIGIGFKSIFRITDIIEIHSGEFHFKFDKSYWDEEKRGGEKIGKWPWEILPVEISPTPLPEGYNTGFFIQFKKENLELLREMKEYLLSKFPSETILLLKNIEEIEIKTLGQKRLITKKVEEKKDFPFWGEEIVNIIDNGKNIPYLVFRKDIKVPEEIQKDEETQRIRSGVKEREIGLIFKLGEDSTPIPSEGKLAGVYSFLPIIGEPTGLPFGIFGDFIPSPGREVIKYEARWNEWIVKEISKFFKELVNEVFIKDEKLKFLPAMVISNIKPYKWESKRHIYINHDKFWDDEIGKPTREFLKTGKFYPDINNKLRKLDELVTVDQRIIKILGEERVIEIVNKKLGKYLINRIFEKIGELYDWYEEKFLIKKLEMSEFIHILKEENDPKNVLDLTLLLIEEGREIKYLVADDNTIQSPDRLFVPDAPLNWMPVWESGFLKNYKPIHRRYIDTEEKRKKAYEVFKKIEIHGFDKQKDKKLVEEAAYNIAKKALEKKGHRIKDVSTQGIGYDFECEHCTKVFEIKGQIDPHDIEVTSTEYNAMKRMGNNYILIVVYNLPNHIEKIGYKEIISPISICEPFEKAKIPLSKWLKNSISNV